MSIKVWSSVAMLVLLTTGCAGTVPVSPPAPAAAESSLTLYAISDADLAALSDAQFGALSDLQIAALSQSQVALLSEARLAVMTPSQRVALLLAQFSALTLPQVKALPPALFAALTPDQLRTLTPVHAQAMTAEQLAALSPEQVAATAAASAAPEDAEGPSKALPPSPPGLKPGLFLNVINGVITLSNMGPLREASAGQFGYVRNISQPPIVLPANPAIKFVPPPTFTAGTATGASPKPAAIDCVVRYEAMQSQPAAPLASPTAAPATTDTKTDTVKTDTVKKTYCN